MVESEISFKRGLYGKIDKMHAKIAGAFENTGESGDWYLRGRGKFSGYPKWLRQMAIGDKLIIDYVEFSPPKQKGDVFVRMERIIEDDKGEIAGGGAVTFETVGGAKIKSGTIHPRSSQIDWDTTDRYALRQARKMVSRI